MCARRGGGLGGRGKFWNVDGGKRGSCGEGYEGRLGVAKFRGQGAENIVCRP